MIWACVVGQQVGKSFVVCELTPDGHIGKGESAADEVSNRAQNQVQIIHRLFELLDMWMGRTVLPYLLPTIYPPQLKTRCWQNESSDPHPPPSNPPYSSNPWMATISIHLSLPIPLTRGWQPYPSLNKTRYFKQR